MSDPPRLLDRSTTAASTLELLRALQPPEGAPPAIKTALVKDLSGLVASSGLKAAGLGLWAKASLLGAVALSVAGVTTLARSPQPPPPPAAPVTKVAAPEPAVVEVRSLPEPSVSPAPLDTRGTPSPDKAKVSASPPRDALAEEEALLESARRVVASSPARALGLLRQHQSRFPSGQLGAERMFLSVECLQRLGNIGAAQREAGLLTQRYPDSAYARRVAQLLNQPAPR